MICIYRTLETYGLCWISGGGVYGVRAQTLQRFDLQGHSFQTNEKRETQRAILPSASLPNLDRILLQEGEASKDHEFSPSLFLWPDGAAAAGDTDTAEPSEDERQKAPWGV